MVGTYNISTLQFQGYKNAVLETTNTTTHNTNRVVSNNPYYIGWGGDTSFSGNIASFMLYDRILSVAEIQENFNAMRRRYRI
jgi:hypothetical protein